MNWVKQQETADPGGQGRNGCSSCSSRLANGWHAGMEGGAARSSLLWKRLCVQILYEISWFLKCWQRIQNSPPRPSPSATHKKRHGESKVIQAKQNTSAGWISIWEDQSKTLERIWAPRCGGWAASSPQQLDGGLEWGGILHQSTAGQELGLQDIWIFIFKTTNSQQILETATRIDHINPVQGIRMENGVCRTQGHSP